MLAGTKLTEAWLFDRKLYGVAVTSLDALFDAMDRPPLSTAL